MPARMYAGDREATRDGKGHFFARELVWILEYPVRLAFRTELSFGFHMGATQIAASLVEEVQPGWYRSDMHMMPVVMIDD